MKFFYHIAALLLIVSVALTACHKDSKIALSSAELTVADTGKTQTFTTGQTFKVVLENPGDGGYDFNTWQYDPSILKIDSHTHIAPANPNVIGDFGTDTWEFTTIKSGTTTLKITASQNSQNTVTMFNDMLEVN